MIPAAVRPDAFLGLQTADWLVLGLYFVVILGIGIWSYRKVKDMSDFFMGGRRFGKIFMMFFAFGAGTSSEQAIGVVAGTWRAGLAGIWWQFLWLWATPFYWIVAPVMRRMRALTTADFFQARFGTSTATLYSIYGIIMSIAFIAGGLFSSGKMIEALTGGELEVYARQLDVQVPKYEWDKEKGWFGRGLLFRIPATPEIQQELNAGKVPDAVRKNLGSRVLLSDNVTAALAETGTGWVIRDVNRGVQYPVRNDTQDGREMIRVDGSGWRHVEGYEYAILAITVLFVIYGIAGGLGAAILTDLIQGVLTIAFSFLLLPFVFQEIGGFGQLNANSGIKEGMLNMVTSPELAKLLGREPITIFYVAMLSVTALAGIVVQPHIMGVCGAGKTEMEGRFGFTFGNFLKRFCTMAWTFTGLACIVWYLGTSSPLQHADRPLNERVAAFDDLSQAEKEQALADFAKLPAEEREEIDNDRDLHRALSKRVGAGFSELSDEERQEIDAVDKDFADKLFGKAAYDILPRIYPGLVGLLLASLLAAMMSTGDAQMVVSSGLFTENIYKRFVVKNGSERHYLWVGRVAGLIIVLFALVLQTTFTDVIDMLKVIIKTPAAIGISLWFGVVWRRWTTPAVWLSTLSAAGAWAFVAFYPGTIENVIVKIGGDSSVFFNAETGNMLDSMQMATYLSVGVIVGIVISLVTPREPEEKLDRFYDLIHTPITPGEDVQTPCTLPENPAPKEPKLFKYRDLEIPMPTWVDIVGFLAAWACVGLIVWLTGYLAQVW